jgi:hypothetical protein
MEAVHLTRKPRNHRRCDRGCVDVRVVSLVILHLHSRARAVCGCSGFYHYSIRDNRHAVSRVMTISAASPTNLFLISVVPSTRSSRGFASSSHSSMTNFITGQSWRAGMATMTSVRLYDTIHAHIERPVFCLRRTLRWKQN